MLDDKIAAIVLFRVYLWVLLDSKVLIGCNIRLDYFLGVTFGCEDFTIKRTLASISIFILLQRGQMILGGNFLSTFDLVYLGLFQVLCIRSTES